MQKKSRERKKIKELREEKWRKERELKTIWLEIQDSRFRILNSKFKIQKEKYENAIFKKQFILKNESMCPQ